MKAIVTPLRRDHLTVPESTRRQVFKSLRSPAAERWCFPCAMVVGLDVVPSKPHQPANYHFVYGNVPQGLPFTDDRFDFVHQRFLGIRSAPWW
jgi:hypothetical protein